MGEPASSWESVSPWLRRVGLQSWLWLGIAACVGAVAALLNAISGLVVPFVVALVLAMLFSPIVDRLERVRIPRILGSLILVTVLIAVLVSCLWIMAVGILNQSEAMGSQVNQGIRALSEAAARFNISRSMVEEYAERALSGLPRAAAGAASVFTSGLSGGFAFFIGSFAAVLLLYYLLLDWHRLSRWLSAHLGLPRDLGSTLVDDTTGAVREYFLALTVSSVIVSVTIGSTVALLGLPLALTIGLVTMVTSYIPYLGAIFSGAFAFLVALGSGGLEKALVVLAVVLIVQNVVQTVIQNKLASERLKLHPIVTFTTVIGGGILFGVLGATLANPVAAMVGTFRKRLMEQRGAGADALQPSDSGQ